MPARRPVTLDLLLRKRSIDPDSGCWKWGGATANGGYGIVSVDGRPQRVHRVVANLVLLPGFGPCVLHRSGEPIRRLAKEFGIHPKTARSALLGDTYRG